MRWSPAGKKRCRLCCLAAVGTALLAIANGSFYWLGDLSPLFLQPARSQVCVLKIDYYLATCWLVNCVIMTGQSRTCAGSLQLACARLPLSTPVQGSGRLLWRVPSRLLSSPPFLSSTDNNHSNPSSITAITSPPPASSVPATNSFNEDQPWGTERPLHEDSAGGGGTIQSDVAPWEHSHTTPLDHSHERSLQGNATPVLSNEMVSKLQRCISSCCSAPSSHSAKISVLHLSGPSGHCAAHHVGGAVDIARHCMSTSVQDILKCVLTILWRRRCVKLPVSLIPASMVAVVGWCGGE